MIRSKVKVRSNVEVTTWDARTPELEELARLGVGKKLKVSRGHNLVVLAGRNLLVKLLAGDTVAGVTHFGLGTSNTPVTDADTALGAQSQRPLATQKLQTASVLTVKYFLPTTLLNGSTLQEAGLFNAASGPTMFARYIIDPPIVKDMSVAVTFVWTITFISL